MTQLSPRLNAAIEALRAKQPILLTDDEKRENEADFIFPAEYIKVDIINLMLHYGSGIICLCLTPEDTERLNLPLMVDPQKNASPYQTAFTLSIDAKHGVSTGVSAQDRMHTIQTAVKDQAQAEDLVRPGHIFPLKSAKNGVLERPGHTEGSVDLMRMAGLKPTAVLCELMNPDGSMAKLTQAKAFAAQHQLCMISIADIVEHRQSMERNRSAR